MYVLTYTLFHELCLFVCDCRRFISELFILIPQMAQTKPNVTNSFKREKGKLF